MKTILIIIGIILLVLIVGKINISFRFKNQVDDLFDNAEKSDKIYSINQLNHLPEPVKRYFKYVLKEGQP